MPNNMSNYNIFNGRSKQVIESYFQKSSENRLAATLSGTWEHLRGDRTSIFLLLTLYIIQGVPLGISGIIPLLLQAKKVTMFQQSVLSASSYPFA